MIFREYNKSLDNDIDEWGKEEYSYNFSIVNRFALFGKKLSEIYEWYCTHICEMSNIFDKIIVVEENNIKLAIIIFNYYYDQEMKKVAGINPILINPLYINRGLGKKIIREIISLNCNICNMKPDYIYAGIDVDNIPSKKIFEANGFELYGNSDDGLFDYYKYRLKK